MNIKVFNWFAPRHKYKLVRDAKIEITSRRDVYLSLNRAIAIGLQKFVNTYSNGTFYDDYHGSIILPKDSVLVWSGYSFVLYKKYQIIDWKSIPPIFGRSLKPYLFNDVEFEEV